jgi:hypothetical protein
MDAGRIARFTRRYNLSGGMVPVVDWAAPRFPDG